MEERKQTNGWKIVAITFIILFTLETMGIILAAISITKEKDKTNECFYDICSEYENAYYLDNLCECIEYDDEGYETVAKSKYMK